MSQRDLFLCHAHADRDAYVRPLANELRKYGVTLWLDEAEIRIGHSITRTIGQGLASSRFVLVFITEAFLTRNWPYVEMQSALSKEAASGEVTLLPVVSLPHERFMEEFPLLRDKHYLRWTGDTEQMVAAILEAIGTRFEEEWTYFFPVEYRGPVWIRFHQHPDSAGSEHRYALRWGPWTCDGVFTSVEPMVCFNMTKGPDRFAVPLFVQVSPACGFAGGTGTPPCRTSSDINYAWTRG